MTNAQLPLRQPRHDAHTAATIQQIPTIWGILRQIGTAILYAVAIIVALLLAIPVLLVFIGTSVPLPIAIGLALADIGIVIAILVLERSVWLIIGAGIGVIAVSILAVWLSQVFASTPPIRDIDGVILPNSIASMETVKLGGVDQWITVRGKNVNNPVLLFLAGGPGGSELAWTRQYLGKLEDHFVVVNWEQPGAGKSYAAADIAALTPERYITDAHELVNHLRARFKQEKLYVLGES